MKYSLFIGRFQPLHEGHIKLIRTVLDEGKKVCVLLKDTGKDEKNPYTLEERMEMFKKAFPKDGENIIFIAIQGFDIDEVCYGRKVGWGIREIKLDKKIEAISATKIRAKIK